MIVAVCGDKSGTGAPLGVSTVTVALARYWPGERLMLEADPSGGDGLFRLTHTDGGPLHPEPTLLSLAADARNGLAPHALPSYGQTTGIGVPVIVSPTSGETCAPVARFWPALAEAASGWSGTVLADLGRLGAAHPSAAAFLPRADVVLLLVRADVAGLYRLRDRVLALASQLAPTGTDTPRLAVAVRTGRAERSRAVTQVQELLDSIGSPVPIVGVVVDDQRAAARVWTDVSVRRASRRSLLGSVQGVAEALLAMPIWPPVLDAGHGEHAAASSLYHSRTLGEPA